MRIEQICIRHFQYAWEATDVYSQQPFRPSGNIQGGNLYYSEKHELYGFEVFVSVLANRKVLDYAQHYPGRPQV